MSKQTLILFAVFATIAGVLVALKLFRYYNSPEAERHSKRRMQGPFVPLSSEEIAEDEDRIAASKSPR